MEETFYGQPLDCPDGFLTEWHTCPECGLNLCDGCECERGSEYAEELVELYREHYPERYSEDGACLAYENLPYQPRARPAW